MTKLLEKAFEAASKLFGSEQNALARWLSEELESGRKWELLFAESEDFLGTLADEAIKVYRQGKTVPLDIDKL